MRKERNQVIYTLSAGQPSRFVVDLNSGLQKDACRLRPAACISKRSGQKDVPAGQPWFFSWPKRSIAPKIDLLRDRPLSAPALPQAAPEAPEAIADDGPALGWRIRLSWSFRPAMAFLCLMAALIAPLKGLATYRDLMDYRGRVLGDMASALDDLSGGGAAILDRDFGLAAVRFQDARSKVERLKRDTALARELSFVLRKLPLDDARAAANAGHVIEAAEQAAALGQELSAFLSGLDLGETDLPGIMRLAGQELKTISARVGALSSALRAIEPDDLPPDFRDQARAARELAGSLDKAVGETGQLAGLIDHLLGFGRDRRLLLVFQNNTEKRASGGFIGSYAIVDLSEGRIKGLEVPAGGSYDTTAGLRDFIRAPEPLWLVNARWFFWDANWWPDWPKTARKLQWFLERSNGPTVDGVISLTPTVMERFLGLIGPVDLPEYGLTLDQGNFWPVVQAIVEEKPPEGEDGVSRHEPKRIIGDLFAALLEEAPKRLDRQGVLALAGLVFSAFDEEQMLAQLNDAEAAAILADFGWDGRTRPAEGDYLQVVHSNIAGGKTDKVVGERLFLSRKALSDGSVVNRLTIERPHSGEPRAPLTGVRNVDWIRVYVPAGSELLESSGWRAPDEEWFKAPEDGWLDDPDVAAGEGKARAMADGTRVYEEDGKAVFANWSMVDPGMTEKIELTYRLPARAGAARSLTVEKQPGSLNTEFKAEIALPDGRLWTASDALTADRIYTIE